MARTTAPGLRPDRRAETARPSAPVATDRAARARRATTPVTRQRRPPDVAICGGGGSSCFLTNELFVRLAKRYGTWQGGAAAYSGLMPANLMTLAHFSVSSATSLAKAAGEPVSTVPPRSVNRAKILGSVTAVWTSLFSVSMIAAGVFLGAPRPLIELASYLGTNSPSVGISGSPVQRVAVVTPNG